MLKLSGNEKILIVRLTALGDCIHTIPLACAIKKIFPDIFIGWAVSEKCKDLIIDNPVIDKVHIIPKKDNKNYWQTIKNIRKEKYTVSIDSQELFKSGIISFLSGAKYRLAHDKAREFSYLFANRKLEPVPIFDLSRHVIMRNMDFARYLSINSFDIDFSLPQTTAEISDYIKTLLKDTAPNKKNIVISPATTWITKFWTSENWAEVLKFLKGKANIILTGGKSDIEYIKEITDLSENSDVINLAGKTNILQLKALFEQADVLITPDSGSAHLASAVKKPVIISLFGATSTVRNGAFGETNLNLTAGLNCKPCYKKVCKYTKGIPPCMTAINSYNVINKLADVLKNEI